MVCAQTITSSTLPQCSPSHNAHKTIQSPGKLSLICKQLYCKHKYKTEVGGSRKDKEHNSRGIAVFCLPHFMDNLCYLLVRSGAKKYLSPAGNQKKKKVMWTQKSSIMFLGKEKTPNGDAGFRTQDLLHAKQTLYH